MTGLTAPARSAPAASPTARPPSACPSPQVTQTIAVPSATEKPLSAASPFPNGTAQRASSQ